jgi:hypothetical protein
MKKDIKNMEWDADMDTDSDIDNRMGLTLTKTRTLGMDMASETNVLSASLYCQNAGPPGILTVRYRNEKKDLFGNRSDTRINTTLCVKKLNTTPTSIVLHLLINFPAECSMYQQTFLQNQTPTPIVFHLLLNCPTKLNPTAISDWGGIGGILDIPESY